MNDRPELRVLEADEIACPWCRLPWALHPRGTDGEFECHRYEPQIVR